MTREEFEKLRDEEARKNATHFNRKYVFGPRAGTHQISEEKLSAFQSGADFAWQFIERLERENKVLREGLEKFEHEAWEAWSENDSVRFGEARHEVKEALAAHSKALEELDKKEST